MRTGGYCEYNQIASRIKGRYYIGHVSQSYIINLQTNGLILKIAVAEKSQIVLTDNLVSVTAKKNVFSRPKHKNMLRAEHYTVYTNSSTTLLCRKNMIGLSHIKLINPKRQK